MDKMGKGKRVGKKLYENRGFGGNASSTFQGFSRKKDAWNNGTRLRDITGPNWLGNYGSVSGWFLYGSGPFFNMLFGHDSLGKRHKYYRANSFVLVRWLRSKKRKLRPFKWGRITGPCVLPTNSSALEIDIYIYIYLFFVLYNVFAVKLLSGPSLALSGVTIWSK